MSTPAQAASSGDVVVIDPVGAGYVETGRWITGDAPSAVAVDRSGRVLVTVQDKVLVFTTSGTQTGAFVTDIGGDGITSGPDGSIYVSGFSEGVVQKHTASGALVGSFTSEDFFAPWGLQTVPTTGQLWIANSTGQEVDRVQPDAAPVGSYGTGNGQFDHPTDIGYGNGSMYVVDRDNYRVQRFSASTGAFQGAWGQSGYGPGQLHDPAAVDTTPDGRVLVLDSFMAQDSELEQFTASGGYLGTSRIPASYVSGLATDAAGNVYIAGLVDYPQGGWGIVRMSPYHPPVVRHGVAKLKGKRVNANHKRKRAALTLKCSKAGPCTGTVKVLRKGKKLAKGHYSLAAGHKGKQKVKLTGKARTLLRKKARVPVKVTWTTPKGTKKHKAVLTR